MDVPTIASLLERVSSATEADRELDAEIDVALFGGETVWKQANGTMEMYPATRRPSTAHLGGFANEHVPLYTASSDAALGLVYRALPGWMWRLASCCVSDDAWVCPDFNHPTYGAALQARFNAAFDGRDPAEAIIEITDVDRRPAGQPALALVESVLRALSPSLKEQERT